MAAAVVLPSHALAPLAREGLTDSKALASSRRRLLVERITTEACSWAVGQASAREIDRLGIRAATEAAMLRALQRLAKPPKLLLVDGVLPLRCWKGEQRTLVRGDSSCPAIAAASILAKEARDDLIRRLAQRLPGYGLERHVGYGTRQHREAVLRIGPSALHRRSFLTRLLADPSLSAADTSAGSLGATAG